MSIVPHNSTFAATCCAALALLLASATGPAQAGGRHGGHGSHYSGKHHGHGAHRHHGHRHAGHRHSGRWRSGVSIGIGIGTGGYGYGYGWPWWTPGYGVVLPPPVVYASPPPRAELPPEPLANGPPDPIFYPRRGQSAAQTEADLHDCNRWALGQPNAVARADVFHRATLACMEGREYAVR